ncbi:MAG: 30S ribosomal protein S16 [Acidobacteria bacterium]|jgi:small subunit ribosomal protein S16|nr:30S ribosomal protein S16 [Acidobacteriota bacterium]
MLTIRLRRVGAKHNAIYRMVVSDSRQRPTADFLDQVGFYNPNTDPPEIRIDLEKVSEWRGKGAQMSETVRSLVRKAEKKQ